MRRPPSLAAGLALAGCGTVAASDSSSQLAPGATPAHPATASVARGLERFLAR